MRLFLFCILFFACLFQVNGQEHGLIGDAKQEIIDHYLGLRSDNKEYEINFHESNDSLYVFLNGFEKIDLIFHFEIEDDVEVCSSIQVTYDCSPCGEEHLIEALEEKWDKWRKMDEDTYISPRWHMQSIVENIKHYYCPRMKIQKVSNDKSCLIIRYDLVKLDENSWLDLKKVEK